MDKKIVFFDIDGTLVDEKTHDIPESTRKAIRELRANGHLAFINTGRPLSEITHNSKSETRSKKRIMQIIAEKPQPFIHSLKSPEEVFPEKENLIANFIILTCTIPIGIFDYMTAVHE